MARPLAAEDPSDIVAFDRAMREGGEKIPTEFVKRLIDGEHPLRVFRDLGRLSQMQLSERFTANQVQFADTEAGRKNGSIETVRKLAQTLRVEYG